MTEKRRPHAEPEALHLKRTRTEPSTLNHQVNVTLYRQRCMLEVSPFDVLDILRVLFFRHQLRYSHHEAQRSRHIPLQPQHNIHVVL